MTEEGDRLNLKSKLTQYLALAKVFSNGNLPEMEIVVSNKEDMDRLAYFVLSGEIQ